LSVDRTLPGAAVLRVGDGEGDVLPLALSSSRKESSVMRLTAVAVPRIASTVEEHGHGRDAGGPVVGVHGVPSGRQPGDVRQAVVPVVAVKKRCPAETPDGPRAGLSSVDTKAVSSASAWSQSTQDSSESWQ
jgi:hypothetical protein